MTSLALRAALAVALALGSAGAATIGYAQAVPATAAIGPAVGTRIATGAMLTDSNGKKTTLAAVAHGKPMMVILFRSAKWCPYCQGQLKSLGPVAAAAKAKGVGFIAISYDSPADLAAFAA
ncbi:redoxin domain-containing protein, partial [Sphingomonas sp.]|uniref:redoxin domain-containing protein n=1 Tax=Sphingomonas sp. TaxID=28214 RepID=UPI00333E7290